MASILDLYAYRDSTLNSNSVIMGKDATQMDMNDFFNLLVAQMTNQDMMNPQSETDFIAQMAQFTTLQGMQTIQEYQLSSYAVSYVGKEVVIANVNEATGNIEQIQGTVSNITFYDGEPMVVVKGTAYPLYTVMEVIASGYDAIGQDGEGIKTDGSGSSEEPADDANPGGDGNTGDPGETSGVG